jgi:hypothetical protein
MSFAEKAPSALGLWLRAVIAQVVVGAPFGFGDFARALDHTHQPALAWAIAYGFGCYRAIGTPLVLGGFLIGISERPGRLWALFLAGAPVAFEVGGYLATLVAGFRHEPPMGRIVGGTIALWVLNGALGLVGYGLGRIWRLRGR